MRTILMVLSLIVVIGIALGVYLVLNMGSKIETPATPAEIPVETVAPLPGSEAAPEETKAATPETVPETTSGETSAQPAAVPTPPQSTATTTTKPADPKPETRKPVESEKPEPTPAPQRPRSCKQAVRGGILLCNIEGASRFWRCAPDGENWNNDLPGCERNTGRDSSRPY
ncbi:hypothetical protein AGMMS49545_23890 [Betaproteobacteria bacterium]|nr:hypothetical protein AGMMS49545_23890 [Betaproteobacteria bacterium]GHU49913.1 hypothetical protein AGMMS50289_26830 [Betaproteobacteria bacterium]